MVLHEVVAYGLRQGGDFFVYIVHVRMPYILIFVWTFLLLVPYNKQLNNLDRSVVTGKSQTSAYWPRYRYGKVTLTLSLTFSRNDLTLGYLVVSNARAYFLSVSFTRASFAIMTPGYVFLSSIAAKKATINPFKSYEFKWRKHENLKIVN